MALQRTGIEAMGASHVKAREHCAGEGSRLIQDQKTPFLAFFFFFGLTEYRNDQNILLLHIALQLVRIL